MLILLVTVFVLFFVYYFLYKRHYNFPPGPRGYPLLGFAPIFNGINAKPHIAVKELTKQYGNIIGVYFSNIPTVIVSGYEAVKQVFTNEDFDGRQKVPFASFPKSYLNKGIIFADGDSWRSQRRFTLRHLRDLGFGKKSMESIIIEEVQDLLAEIKHGAANTVDSSVQSENLFGPSLLNMIWHIVAGVRYKHNDPELLYLMEIVTEAFKAQLTPKFVDRIPFFNKIKWSENKLSVLEEYFKNTVADHQQTFDPNHNRDFIDIYLSQIKQNGDSQYFNTDQLCAVMFDLFIAGTETSSNTMTFMLLYVILYPDVQKKIQNEIDDVIGKNRLPSVEDKVNLPYTEATMREVFRIGTVAPLTVYHCAVKDTKLGGYDIPKGTMVLPSIDSVHKEETYWKDPETFIPERFIKDGKLLPQDDHILTFSTGHRSCIGEVLSRQTTFLMLTSLLQTFNFSQLSSERVPHPVHDVLPGLALSLPNFRFKVTCRI